jgi:hypothetical protein
MFFVIILSFIAAGAIVGFIATKAVNLRGDAPILSIGCAAAGGLVAGIIYGIASGNGVTTWSVWGVVTAAIGGLVAAVVWHVIRSRSISHDRYVPRQSY